MLPSATSSRDRGYLWTKKRTTLLYKMGERCTHKHWSKLNVIPWYTYMHISSGTVHMRNMYSRCTSVVAEFEFHSLKPLTCFSNKEVNRVMKDKDQGT